MKADQSGDNHIRQIKAILLAQFPDVQNSPVAKQWRKAITCVGCGAPRHMASMICQYCRSPYQ